MHDGVRESMDQLHRDLGLKKLRGTWAKLEIVFGLLACGIGLMFMLRGMSKPIPRQEAGGLVLFVLGGYLAMAGHRSHLYQSSNALAAWLRTQIREPSRDSSASPNEPKRLGLNDDA